MYGFNKILEWRKGCKLWLGDSVSSNRLKNAEAFRKDGRLQLIKVKMKKNLLENWREPKFYGPGGNRKGGPPAGLKRRHNSKKSVNGGRSSHKY